MKIMYRPWMMPFIKMYVNLTPEMIGYRIQILKIRIETYYHRAVNLYYQFKIARLHAEIESLKKELGQ